MATIMVVTEIRENKLKNIDFEVFSTAVKMAEQTGDQVAAFFAGEKIGDLPQKAGEYGVSNCWYVEDKKLAKYSPDVMASIVADVTKQKDVSVILMGATAMGKDLLPRVAIRLESTVAQDIIDFSVEGNELVFLRPMYAGKVRARVKIASSPKMATLRSRAFQAVEKKVEVNSEALSVEIPEPKVVVEEMALSSAGKLDVTEADIIISGGRGLKGPENWHLIEDLAEVMGAATGCSRPVSDEGWRDHGEHIGQTGKTVAPTLYVACGISGAIQHIAGMSSSKYIVAINKDPEAPIFKIADYGIVGDVFEVLPALTEEIRKVKGS